MATEPASPQRLRAVLLGILAVAVVALVAYWLWPAASSSRAASNQQRPGRQQAATSGVNPAALDVRLEALKVPPPQPTDAERNPFRFQPKPPPPPPPASSGTQPQATRTGPPGPPPPPPIPPIPLKFIGTLERRGTGKVAIFSDNRGTPLYGREGDIILGQYRIVRIGVESVVMEYLDGRGRQTIPLRGQ